MGKGVKMTAKKINARPQKLKPSVKSLIAKRAIENPNYDRRLLALELIKEIKKAGEIQPTEDTLIKYISEARSKYTIDKAWNTSVLNSEPISPDALPWLIGVQVHLKSYCSKPLTIREAKWFNRLSGFRYTFPVSLESLGISDRTKDAFLSLVIATWAQIYAYREKIDTIARIKEPDYS